MAMRRRDGLEAEYSAGLLEIYLKFAWEMLKQEMTHPAPEGMDGVLSMDIKF